MALTQQRGGTRADAGTLFRYHETGAANTLLTSALSPRGAVCRLVMVTVSYSATPTQAGATVTLNSGAGAAYDAVILSGSANARYSVLIPGEDLLIMPDDGIDVTAPAGGAAITASVTIYLEHV